MIVHLLRVLAVAALLVSLSIPATHAQTPPDEPGAMTFVVRSNGGNCNGCEWIAAQGTITTQTPENFRRFLRENSVYQGTTTTVVFDSAGGNLAAGLALGVLIREARFWTSTGRTVPFPELPQWFTTAPGICMSACAYAFLGGVERFAEAGSLGFHQFYSPEALRDPLGRNFSAVDLAETQILVGLVALYLKRVEADPEILFIASATLPNEMYRPSEEEMRRLGIVTGGTAFSGWTIEPYGAGAVVTGSIRYNSHEQMQITVFCRRNAANSVFIMGSSTTWAPSGTAAGQPRTDALRAAISHVSFQIGRQVIREGFGSQGLSEVRVDNAGRAYMTFAMSREEFLRGVRDGLAVEVTLPRVLGAMARIEPPRLGLQAKANVALRVCL